jgi:hypothetical protein
VGAESHWQQSGWFTQQHAAARVSSVRWSLHRAGILCASEMSLGKREARIKVNTCMLFSWNIAIYNHAYLEYNISMVVKDKANPIGKIRDILKDQNGILLTSDLLKHGIPRTYLSILEKKGEVQRISRGVYSATGYMVDEMVGIQARYKVAIFSHETALYLLGLSDRTPLFYSVTVPAGYNATSLKANGVKVYFVNRELYRLGSITLKSPHGNDIKTLNLERTVCDILRSRNQVDIQQVNEVLKRYVKKREKDLDLLYNYARQFRIQKIVSAYIEVLL